MLRKTLQLARNGLFLCTVFLPTLVAVIYYGLWASDVFVSESKFVVRSPQRQQSTSVLGAILSGSGFSRSQEDAFSVQDFVLSRDSLALLNDKLGIRKAFSDSNIDPLARFPSFFEDDSFESLYKYYLKHVNVLHDSSTSITQIKVRAYTADHAYQINEMLLSQGEQLINQINNRGRQDLIKYAQAEVIETERRAKEASLALAGFRNQRSVFDPERQSVLQLQQINKLQDEIIASKLQLFQVRSLSPDNPQVPVLQRRVTALESEMKSEMSKISGSSTNTLTNKASDFERLSLERAFADRQLASALSSLEGARNEARRQALYLERIVQPNKPDIATEPKRLKNILVTFILGLISWGVLSMLISGIKEHKD